MNFCLITLLLLVLCNAQDEPVTSCAAISCSLDEDRVWAVADEKCYLFRNDCFVRIENCLREANNGTELEIVPQRKCVPLCEIQCSLNEFKSSEGNITRVVRKRFG